MRTIIHNATIVNEGRIFKGSVIINDDIIEDIVEGGTLHFPLSTFHLIINATPVGMYPDIDQSPLDLASHFSFLTSHFVYDLIYNPSPTLLMRQAARHGAHVKDGLEMLYLQAQLSWELFRNV